VGQQRQDGVVVGAETSRLDDQEDDVDVGQRSGHGAVERAV